MDDIKEIYLKEQEKLKRTDFFSTGFEELDVFCKYIDKGNVIFSDEMSGRDDLVIYVTGNDDRIVVASSFDNLGKGASGAAIQNMNIVMGIDEATGLVV